MSRVAAIAALLLMTTSASAWEVGDTVVAVRRARLVDNGQTVDSVSPGVQLSVLAIEGNRLQVTNGTAGWIESSAVAAPAAAIEQFTAAVRRNPRDAETIYARGNVLRALGRFDEAIADFNRLVQLAPQAAAYNGRGRVWFELGNYDNAINDFTRALEQAPNNPMLYNNRSAAWELQGNHERAMADLEQALRHSPDHDLVQHNRNRLLQARKAGHKLAATSSEKPALQN
ncbi:MAG: tetratricopeptide repeat protein [Planctomycetes bacterium]|nr:tetratricopeptide repeat protein [Planctomycetota bacterium]